MNWFTPILALFTLALAGCVGMTPATTGKQVHDLKIADGLVGMTPVAGGVLSTTYQQRFTDEAILRDWEAMDALRARIAKSRPNASSAYAVERAEAELNFAVEEYEENDRTGILEPLLDDARRLIATQEPGHKGAVDLSLPVLPAVKRVRDDLWKMAGKAKENPRTLKCAGREIARLEAGLLELSHELYEVEVKMNAPEHIGPYAAIPDGLAASLKKALASEACLPPPIAPPVEIETTERVKTATRVEAAVEAEPIILSAAALFGFDKCREADILPEGRAKLDRFGALLAKQPDAWKRLTITGHTDRLGRRLYNLRLSQCRADAVRDYLVKNSGLPASRIETRGMGATQPRVFCSGPVNAQLRNCLQPNRRVEMELK